VLAGLLSPMLFGHHDGDPGMAIQFALFAPSPR
jgi:hypothetical protein